MQPPRKSPQRNPPPLRYPPWKSRKLQFVRTCEWLENINKIKTINTKHTSYGLKHIAEKHIGYITNGVFIAAAIYCGFDFKVRARNPNVMFNMSEKSIKEISQRSLGGDGVTNGDANGDGTDGVRS